MNWDAIGSIGEIVGAAAVVITLYYLAVQIRQNSRLVQRSNEYADATSVYESQSMYMQCFSQLANDGELADIYRRFMNGEAIDGTDQIRAEAFIMTYVVWLEKTFLQAETNVG
jgi:hypothetical protein